VQHHGHMTMTVSLTPLVLSQYIYIYMYRYIHTFIYIYIYDDNFMIHTYTSGCIHIYLYIRPVLRRHGHEAHPRPLDSQCLFEGPSCTRSSRVSRSPCNIMDTWRILGRRSSNFRLFILCCFSLRYAIPPMLCYLACAIQRSPTLC
jgi:hypothetical protein